MTKTLEGWTLVFDLDGTLVETAPDLVAALNHVLKQAGLEAVAQADVRGLIGNGAKAMIREGLRRNGIDFDEGRINQDWHHFLDHYRANIDRHSHPYPGCIEALNALDARGARLAVCTNKTQALSEQLLDALDLSPYFAAIVGADCVTRRKPDGDHVLQTIARAGGQPGQAIMIGDSQTDEKAARNAGLPFIFVPFGYHSGTTDTISADAVVTHYSDLLSVISAITA